MSSGPEHYLNAERLIDEAHTVQYDSGPGCGSEELLAEALVHAVLAQAAASALNVRKNGAVEAVDEAAGWERVLGG